MHFQSVISTQNQRVHTRLTKNGCKPARRTLAERVGIKQRRKEMEQDGHAEELTQENSDELDTSVKDEELVCYRARRLVPCTDLRNGMARLHFLLDTCSPGKPRTSVPTDR